MTRHDTQPLKTDTPMRWFWTGNECARAERGAQLSHQAICRLCGLPDCGWFTVTTPRTQARQLIGTILPTAPAAAAALNPHSAERVAPGARCTA